jgi:4'-phosphopantetheinyl transferase EntD
VIADILPPQVAAAEEFGDLPDVRLFPDEEAVMANAVDNRRREFATARACARTALAKLGVPAAPIVPGSRGAPQWPPGVVLGRDVVTIGLDAEPNDTLPDGVLKVVACDAEAARIVALKAAMPEVSWDRLLFSAKESVYKAWFPLARRWLNFKDTRVDFDPVHPTFSARLLVDGPVVNGEMLTGLDGRWLVGNGLLATAIVILRRGEGAG